MAVLRNIAGSLGSAIDKLPGRNSSGSLFGNPYIDISSTLQNWGGNTAGSLKSAVVRPAYASGGQVLGTQNQSPSFNNWEGVTNNSGPGGAYPIAGGKQGGGGAPAPQQNQVPQNPVEQPSGNNGPSELDVINQEFDAFNSFLSDQAGLAQENFATTEQTILGEKEAGLKDVAGERGIRAKELEGKALQGRDNERLNLQRARQLLQDLDQRNAARLSITGGGSLSDALADRFARTSQQSIGGIQQEGQRFQNDVAIEAERANQFYDSKKREIESQASNQIAQARQALNQNLSAIEGERRASAAEKQRARLDAWRGYYNNVNEARLQAANFQVQYDMWKRQLDAQLAAAQGYQTSDIAGQDFNPAMAYAQQGLNIGSIPQGVGSNPALAATYFNPGARPDQNEEDYLSQG